MNDVPEVDDGAQNLSIFFLEIQILKYVFLNKIKQTSFDVVNTVTVT